jgi:glutathione S-transferase
MLVHASVTEPNATEETRRGMLAFGTKYGYSAAAAAAAPAKVARILQGLAARLESQRSRGSRFLVGDALSALDIYWAVFAALIEPLPENLCPMPSEIRRRYNCEDPAVRGATSPQLLAHRDFIYHEYLELPVDL